MLRKQAIEKDRQLRQLQDSYIGEKREKQQLITKLQRLDESNQKVDNVIARLTHHTKF